jgi:hypothetical protein
MDRGGSRANRTRDGEEDLAGLGLGSSAGDPEHDYRDPLRLRRTFRGEGLDRGDRWLGGLQRPERTGYSHEATTLRKNYLLADVVQPKVHLLFSNLKAWLVGTFHGISIHYLPAYLQEVVYRLTGGGSAIGCSAMSCGGR